MESLEYPEPRSLHSRDRDRDGGAGYRGEEGERDAPGPSDYRDDLGRSRSQPSNGGGVISASDLVSGVRSSSSVSLSSENLDHRKLLEQKLSDLNLEIGDSYPWRHDNLVRAFVEELTPEENLALTQEEENILIENLTRGWQSNADTQAAIDLQAFPTSDPAGEEYMWSKAEEMAEAMLNSEVFQMVQEGWEEMSEAERLEASTRVLQDISTSLGIEGLEVRIENRPESRTVAGVEMGLLVENPTVILNAPRMVERDFPNLVETVGHEISHTVQQEMLKDYWNGRIGSDNPLHNYAKAVELTFAVGSKHIGELLYKSN